MSYKNEQGFTLIELLVVVAIVGILTSITLPQFSRYKERAFDTQAQSDLRNVALAEEAYFIDAESYLSCQNSNCNQLPGISSLTKGVTLTVTATATGFTATSQHSKGSGKTFAWDSNAGGMAN